MQFYTSITDGDRTIWTGTQADARAIDRNFVPVDVPTDKPNLLLFLNEMQERIDTKPVAFQPDYEDEVTPEQIEVIKEIVATPPPPPPTPFTLTDVEEFIQSSTPAELARLSDNVCWRIKELMQALDTKSAVADAA